MRIIDGHALLDRLREQTEVTKNPVVEAGLLMAKWTVFEIPTIDAVEVVRCGECKHMIADGRCMEFADDGIRPSAADFCSYGERREDGE